LESVRMMSEVNMYGPHNIADVCNVMGVRLIQISTDCVFSGNRSYGKYTEIDEADCLDHYGVSKLFGEITTPPHLTVRTSFVGWPDAGMRGLLASFYVSSKLFFPGYTNVQWNGLVAPVLAEYLVELSYGRQTGLMHIHGHSVSKYGILKTFSDVFGLNKRGYRIKEAKAEKNSNRTLRSIRHDHPVILHSTNLDEGMELMYVCQKQYQTYRESQ